MIDAFIGLHDPQADLIIAGDADLPDYRVRLENIAGEHPAIHLISDHIPDEELQVYFNAADACVLPYRRATTSGAALLAFSFGKPIVAPALGPFPSLIDGDNGVLFHPENGDLGAAMRQVRLLDPERASAAAYAVAVERDWLAIGAQHAALYRQVAGTAKTGRRHKGGS